MKGYVFIIYKRKWFFWEEKTTLISLSKRPNLPDGYKKFKLIGEIA